MEGDSSSKIPGGNDCRFCLDENSERPLVDKDLPFVTQLSLRPLVEFWEQHANGAVLSVPDQGEFSIEQLKGIPQLFEPLQEISQLQPHLPIVRQLAQTIIPPAAWETELRSLVGVFDATPVLSTPEYERVVPNSASLPKANIDPKLEYQLTLLYGYSMILNRLYDFDLEVDYPIVRQTTDPATGLPLYFQVEVDPQFVVISGVDGTLPELSESHRTQIRNNPSDLEFLARILPPDRFRFEGFIAIHALEVTDQTLLAEINKLLLEAPSVVCSNTIETLQDKLRTLIGSRDLELGLAAFQEDELLLVHSAIPGQEQCIVGDSIHYAKKTYEGSPHEEAATEKKTIIVSDLNERSHRSPIEESLLESGIQNLAVAPLITHDETIGALELKSRTVGTLNPMNTMKIRELLPSFTAAMQRSLREFQNRVDSIIKRECTVIHPSVEWRFREVAAKHLSSNSMETFGNENIAFADVYPLFAATDIRNSSRLRNRSISADLNQELTAVQAILNRLPHSDSIPIFAQALANCESYIEITQKEIRASDEYRITNFLQTEIRELLKLMGARMPELSSEIEKHLNRLDPQHNSIFESRRAYMDSVSRLNSRLGALLETAQESAQTIYPHYFEKHSTDGVDFTMYIGDSLCRDRPFHPLYLDNLRLWQIILMCDLACATRELKNELPIALDTTHLIAVQDQPVSIRFRFDERLFDVDGAYNARYEIMKKRIDKAMIRGRSERLTQPDKIAIVYSNSKEATRYRKHLEYLQSAGYLIPGFEDLQLEDLQGVEGLKAMRVTVNLDRNVGETPSQPVSSPAANPGNIW